MPVIIKASDKFPKGTIVKGRISLSHDSVLRAMNVHKAQAGDRVSIKVKVGKHKKLLKAYLMAEYEQCCDEHSHIVIGYYADR